MSQPNGNMPGMKQVQVWQWTLRDPVTGRVARTRHKMCAEEARALDAMAQRVDGSLEWRAERACPVPDDGVAQSESRVQG